MSSSPSSGPRHAQVTTGRCAACGARLRPEEKWCSLCHTVVPEERVGAQWAPPVQAAIVPDLGESEVRNTPDQIVELRDDTDLRDGELRDGAEPGNGEREDGGRRASAVSGEPDPAVIAAADQLLAQLRIAEAVLARESGLGQVRQRLGGMSPRNAALLLAGVGGTVLLAVTVLGLTLIGLVL
jgi:hypothetical protein